MKRGLFVAAIVLFASAAFAKNVEMDLNIYFTPLEQYTFDEEGDPKFEFQYPIGLDTKWGIMCGAPLSWLDIGVKLSYGFDFFWDVYSETKIHGEKYELHVQDIGDCFGMNANLTLGPLVRFNLGDFHTIYFSPGLMAKLSFAQGKEAEYDSYADEFNEASNSILFFNMGLSFDLDIGYRIWIINRPDYHFGFDIGLDMNFMLVEKCIGGTDIYNADADFGQEYKIYLGLCFNFGGKSPDIHRAN